MDLKTEKYLIVNADDFGLTTSITEGTIAAIENGLVNSVSITANGSAFDSAVEYLKRHPEISTGWHINLTSISPVSINKKSRLFNGKNRLLSAALMSRLDYDTIRAELTLQWQQLSKTGLKITHIDSHHDVHFFPGIRSVVLEFCRELDVQFVRFAGAIYYRKAVSGTLTDRAVFAGVRNLLKMFPVKNMRDVDFIQFRELYHSRNKLNVLKLYAEQLQPGVTEWICHPGYYDANNPLQLMYNRQRQEEINALCSKEIKYKLKECNVELINFRDLVYASNS